VIEREDGRRVGLLCTRIIVLCGFRTKLSAFGDDFPPNRLLTRMTQSWSISPGAHIPLKNKKKLAHPTRFERVTFAFGAR
jgi:hypothetical protein